MKKEYTKPLVTVVTLIADRSIATSPWSDYVEYNDIVFGESEFGD